MTAETTRDDGWPSDEAIFRMVSRMHGTAAASESEAGKHASSSQNEQLGAKYRNAADKAKRGDR